MSFPDPLEGTEIREVHLLTLPGLKTQGFQARFL
jgi:hypothetical protein